MIHQNYRCKNKIYFLGDSWFIEYEGEQLTNNDRIWFNHNNLRINLLNWKYTIMKYTQ